jgi:hypothetical protein
MKFREYNNIYSNQYFWRSYDGAEVDLIEEDSGKIHGYELKWNKTRKNIRPPKSFLHYKNSDFVSINNDNFFEYLLK